MGEIISSFLVAVAAGIVIHIVCRFIDKWIFSRKK